MTRRTLGIIICCLSVLIVPAGAEGSWVLWMMAETSPWDHVATFQTREECMAAMHQQAQAVEKLGLSVTEDVAGGSFVGADADRRLQGEACSTPSILVDGRRSENPLSSVRRSSSDRAHHSCEEPAGTPQ